MAAPPSQVRRTRHRQLTVVNRDGTRVPLELDRITERNLGRCAPILDPADGTVVARGLPAICAEQLTVEIVGKYRQQFEAGSLRTTLIDALVVDMLVTEGHREPQKLDLAARLLVANLHHSTPATFSQAVAGIVRAQPHRLDPALAQFVRANADELDPMVRDCWDYRFDYAGARTLINSYLIARPNLAAGSGVGRPEAAAAGDTMQIAFSGEDTSISDAGQATLNKAVQKLQAELDAAAEPEPLAAGAAFALESGIQFRQVTFRYGAEAVTDRNAVTSLDLSIPARQMTALVGPSGAGKSTVGDLLLGLLTPTEGTVLVAGEGLAGARLNAWRQSIGYVPQEPFLFHDTVRANLLWARADATAEELHVVLRAAAAEEFVARLPQGLDTVVGDRGVRLSGGERQRLTLARALLRRPTLLLLDEATSALDTENERMVQEAIEKLHGELTLVVIAHRLSTIRKADQVIVLGEGRVVESGPPEELARREQGAFRKLINLGTL